jgi:hypothetical protein
MARKPNYRFERAERERLKAERHAQRERRKSEGRGEVSAPSEEPAATPREPLEP